MPEFDKVAFTLKTRQALAKPFETPQYGWFVLKALGPVKQDDREGRREAIRQKLLADGEERAR